MKNKLIILDTNILVSSFLLPHSVSRKVFDKAIRVGLLIASHSTFHEVCEVIIREKFEKYAPQIDRKEYTVTLERQLIFFSPTETITACRGPKDNKFLELAVAANAACIITGDADLLALHPFRNIPILNSVDFLNYNF